MIGHRKLGITLNIFRYVYATYDGVFTNKDCFGCFRIALLNAMFGNQDFSGRFRIVPNAHKSSS